MYFVDRKKIEGMLVYVETMTSLFKDNNDWNKPLYKLALERMAHCIIESILDVGNAMIDGFIMRDPGSYEDIIDILEDEQVVSQAHANSLKNLIAVRKMLVHDYTEVNHIYVAEILEKEMDSIQEFPSQVRNYLQNELGPVSAFRS